MADGSHMAAGSAAAIASPDWTYLASGPLSVCFSYHGRVEFASCMRVSKHWSQASRLRTAWPGPLSSMFDPEQIMPTLRGEAIIPANQRCFSIITTDKSVKGKEPQLSEAMESIAAAADSPWRFLASVRCNLGKRSALADKLVLQVSRAFPHLQHLHLGYFGAAHSVLTEIFRSVGERVTILQHGLASPCLSTFFRFTPNLRALSISRLDKPRMLLELRCLEHLDVYCELFASYPQQYVAIAVEEMLLCVRELSVTYALRTFSLVTDASPGLLSLLVRPREDAPMQPPAALTSLRVMSTGYKKRLPPLDCLVDHMPTLTSLTTDRSLVPVVGDDAQLPQAQRDALPSAAGLPSLVHLSIHLHHRGMGEAEPASVLTLQKTLQRTPNLQRLHIHTNWFQPDDTRDFQLAHLTQLREFKWTNARASDRVSDGFFEQFASLRSLEVLDLAIDATQLFSPPSLSILVTLPLLHRLVFYEPCEPSCDTMWQLLSVEVLRLMARSSTLHSLEFNCPMTSSFVHPLIVAPPKEIIAGVFLGLSHIETEQLLRLRVWQDRHHSFALKRVGGDDDGRWSCIHGDSASCSSATSPLSTPMLEATKSHALNIHTMTTENCF